MKMHNHSHFNIAAVERDTGLGKDTLRVWERRYGFPAPLRDENSERVYTQADLDKIRLVQRLMYQGHRLGKIMHLDVISLLAMLNLPQHQPQVTSIAQAEIVQLLKSHRTIELNNYLRNLLVEQGSANFVMDTLVMMNRQVGDAWMCGQIAIFEEHAYSEQVVALLRLAIAQISTIGPTSPKVLLTTLPGEQHSLGLLMSEVLLTLEGATCVNLGAQMPVSEINAAVRAHQADILCLSYSAAFPKNLCLQSLTELQQLLPATLAIWVGGQGIPRTKLPDGINYVRTLAEIATTVQAWRGR